MIRRKIPGTIPLPSAATPVVPALACAVAIAAASLARAETAPGQTSEPVSTATDAGRSEGPDAVPNAGPNPWTSKFYLNYFAIYHGAPMAKPSSSRTVDRNG